jgi:hypothetical protein
MEIVSMEEQVRHIVILKFRADTSDEQLTAIFDHFRDLKNQIPGIVAFEHGANNSTEGMDQGFTHVVMLTFENAHARDTYLPHPYHLRFVEFLNNTGTMQEAFVVDYSPRP